jgi:hypothetical protein
MPYGQPIAGSSDGWAADWFSLAATQVHVDRLGKKLIEAAGEHKGER